MYSNLLSKCRNPSESKKKQKLFNEFEKRKNIPNANTMRKTNNNVVLFTLSKNRIKKQQKRYEQNVIQV